MHLPSACLVPTSFAWMVFSSLMTFQHASSADSGQPISRRLPGGTWEGGWGAAVGPLGSPGWGGVGCPPPTSGV